jgi:hypothetical protein
MTMRLVANKHIVQDLLKEGMAELQPEPPEQEETDDDYDDRSEADQIWDDASRRATRLNLGDTFWVSSTKPLFRHMWAGKYADLTVAYHYLLVVCEDEVGQWGQFPSMAVSVVLTHFEWVIVVAGKEPLVVPLIEADYARMCLIAEVLARIR